MEPRQRIRPDLVVLAAHRGARDRVAAREIARELRRLAVGLAHDGLAADAARLLGELLAGVQRGKLGLDRFRSDFQALPAARHAIVGRDYPGIRGR